MNLLHLKTKKVEFIKYCLDKEETLTNKLPFIKFNQKLEAVIIEFRLIYYIGFIVKNAIYQLGSEWSFSIVCGEHNYFMFENLVKNIDRQIKIIVLPMDNLTREEYSIMLLNSDFYERFTGEKLLIMQEDTLIFEKWNPKFLNYDYIGAPFSNKEVGNGGFSFRDRKLMIEICRNFFNPYRKEMGMYARFFKKYKTKIIEKYGPRYFDNPDLYFIYTLELKIIEDVQITQVMRKHKLGKLAPFEIAREFSMEKFYHPNVFGGHQFWYCISDVYVWLDKKLKL